MSIKPDKWIRHMAQEYGMIEPFEPRQIRESNHERIISYGTSSYGYDIRCSDEFKIFTNINSAIVDPKNFDASSFVDIQSDVCIIPPNSFVLARTVEYFRIPRNVLTICLGKCVTADTRVVDALTGAYLPITEFSWGRKILGLKEWRLQPGWVSAFLPQGRKPVFELTTRAGLKIRATTNHPFRQLHGWTPLSELKPGDRIAVARHIPVFGRTPLPGWEAILLGLMISEGECRGPDHNPILGSTEPVLVDVLKACMEQGGLGTATYDCRYGDHLANWPGRGDSPERNRVWRWLETYNLNIAAEKRFVPQAIFTAPRETVQLFLKALFSSDGGLNCLGEGVFLKYYSHSRRLVEDVHHLLLRFGIFSLIREKQTQGGTMAYQIQIMEREQILRFTEEVGFWPGSSKQIRLEREILPVLRKESVKLGDHFNSSSLSANVSSRRKSLGVSTRSTQSLSAMEAVKLTDGTEDPNEDSSFSLDGTVWDVVQAIQPAGEEEVYDLTVPGMRNFVANDIIVHNSTYARCGIIVNITPLEPEWEGYVTLEFSNTTPLPAKIYANEGIAQVVFFESDELCETSYKDRGGKYQGQSGVALPKA